MKVFKKLVTAIVSAVFIMTSAATVLADETTAASQPSETASATTTSTFDISKLSFDTMYGTQMPQYLNHEYVFDGKKIPLTESNYYFLLTFMQLSQYASYGYLPATSDGRIDLTATYGEGKTYADYFLTKAEDNLQTTYILLERAKAAGIKLTDEDKLAIEQEIQSMIEQQAKPAGVSLEEIIKLYFGPDCDEKAYRSILENSALAQKYQQKFIADYQIPEDQKMVPSITYALFYAPGASASADEKKKAEDSAKEMLGKCKSIDDLKKLAAEAKTAGTVKDQGTVQVQKGKMVSAFEAWAYDSARKEGEMDVIYAQEYGYFCVGFNGKAKLDDSEKTDMANKALSSELDAEIKAGKHGFKTDKPFPNGASNTGTGTATPSGQNADNGNNTADKGKSNVLIIVFASLGGVAILAIVVILIVNTVNSKKAVSKQAKSGRHSSGGTKKKNHKNRKRR